MASNIDFIFHEKVTVLHRWHREEKFRFILSFEEKTYLTRSVHILQLISWIILYVQQNIDTILDFSIYIIIPICIISPRVVHRNNSPLLLIFWSIVSHHRTMMSMANWGPFSPFSLPWYGLIHLLASHPQKTYQQILKGCRSFCGDDEDEDGDLFTSRN